MSACYVVKARNHKYMTEYGELVHEQRRAYKFASNSGRYFARHGARRDVPERHGIKARVVLLVRRPASDAVNVLVRGHNIIFRKGWTQNCTARTESGAEVSFRKPSAAMFCAIGACWRAEGMKNTGAADYLDRAAPGGCVVKFNDMQGRTKEEVLAVYKRAIKLAREDADKAAAAAKAKKAS